MQTKLKRLWKALNGIELRLSEMKLEKKKLILSARRKASKINKKNRYAGKKK